MPIFDLYSKRNSKEPDIFIYHELSYKLRLQIVYIISDFVEKNNLSEYSTNPFWKFIFEVLTRKHGKSQLVSSGGISTAYKTFASQVLNYLKSEEDVEKVLDTIEISFRCILNYKVF